MSLDEDAQRQLAAQHAMQTGVLQTMAMEGAAGVDDTTSTSPKHLRVGVNTALVNMGALAKLLIAKGVFTMEEYAAAIADAMEDEVRLYERELSAHFGTNITLH